MTDLEVKLIAFGLKDIPEVDDATVKANRERIRRDYPGLLEFDPKNEYAYNNVDHMHMTINTHRIEVGRIANLIQRMSLRGATADEMQRAIRHSMVVIDALKHDLDWRKSFSDFGIKELERKYPRA